VTDDQAPRVFDMPHARVTLTPIGPGIEIEVWPKAGQSAFAVVDPTVAILIAQRLVELAMAQIDPAQLAAIQRAALQLAAMQPATGDETDAAETEDGTDETEASDETETEDAPDNVVDLASRRRPSRPGPA